MGRLWSDLGPIKMLVFYLLILLVGFPEMKTTLDTWNLRWQSWTRSWLKLFSWMRRMEQLRLTSEFSYLNLMRNMKWKWYLWFAWMRENFHKKDKGDPAFFVTLFCSFITMSVHRQQKNCNKYFSNPCGYTTRSSSHSWKRGLTQNIFLLLFLSSNEGENCVLDTWAPFPTIDIV